MQANIPQARIVYATICEVERGLFHINYRVDAGDGQMPRLPPYQVGTCASEARLQIEQHALGCGYVSVIWDDLPVDAGFIPSTTTEILNSTGL